MEEKTLKLKWIDSERQLDLAFDLCHEVQGLLEKGRYNKAIRLIRSSSLFQDDAKETVCSLLESEKRFVPTLILDPLAASVIQAHRDWSNAEGLPLKSIRHVIKR